MTVRTILYVIFALKKSNVNKDISGMPGVGKTVCVNKITNEFMKH